jgi:hypothetical protein
MRALVTSKLCDCYVLKERDNINRSYSPIVIIKSRNDLRQCTIYKDSDFALDMTVRPQVNMLCSTVLGRPCNGIITRPSSPMSTVSELVRAEAHHEVKCSKTV